jgi:hypothetical protein
MGMGYIKKLKEHISIHFLTFTRVLIKVANPRNWPDAEVGN